MSSTEEFKAIIRIAGADCDGSRRVDHAISKIKGVGLSFSRALLRAAEIPLNSRLGYLTDDEIERIEDVLEDPIQHGIPEWMVNRQRSPETGKGYHLIGSDVDIRVRMDIDTMKRMKSWKGIRHSWGLKVRGQRTRTTGRTGRTLGVSRKRVRQAAREQR